MRLLCRMYYTVCHLFHIFDNDGKTGWPKKSSFILITTPWISSEGKHYICNFRKKMIWRGFWNIFNYFLNIFTELFSAFFLTFFKTFFSKHFSEHVSELLYLVKHCSNWNARFPCTAFHHGHLTPDFPREKILRRPRLFKIMLHSFPSLFVPW